MEGKDVTDGVVKAVMFVKPEVGHDQGGGNTLISWSRGRNLT
jgi:hypothetical protein